MVCYVFNSKLGYRASLYCCSSNNDNHIQISKLDYRASLYCCSSNNDNHHQIFEGFSVLDSDIPWESGSVWRTMALYLFSLHIPLSFGRLSVVSQILHQPNLSLETKCRRYLFVIQTLELFSALLLLQFITKPSRNLGSLFKLQNLPNERNWLLAAVLGFLFLILVIFLTSYLADRVFGTKAVNNPMLKEILYGGKVPETACILIYCFVTPLLEEIVYRGFLLTSLASMMKWHEAIVISSDIFSLAHLSGENFLQRFMIGAALGCYYCWTGNLGSSTVLHSLYNALILLVTYLS
ncbi:hypothetical protein Nepgr_000422 [Nepenthes gracilis]|uniref:CAAX prenyl protease 2/Lysostaphin resistance protein A-like domain-containing protein n=1 Tax=Nepenthes gracilis TaxID=150966 RepID=A0AAD3P587_NEPGR|nr:hypothetical protein Nepgr_000422 [Nepenthes gracilis]